MLGAHPVIFHSKVKKMFFKILNPLYINHLYIRSTKLNFHPKIIMFSKKKGLHLESLSNFPILVPK